MNHSKGLSLFVPWCSCNLFKLLFELLESTFVIQLTFKFCQIWDRTTITQSFIEYFHKNFHDGFLAGANLGRTFGINIKEHDIRRNGSGIGHFRNQHRIVDFLAICKVFNGSFSFYLTIFQQVGKNLQEVRFTTSKEAGDPDTHLIRVAVDSLFIVIKEVSEMLQKFFGYYIFFQFLIYIFFIRLTDFDNTFDITVNLFFKHVFNLHSFSPSCLHKLECPVIVSGIHRSK